MSFLLGLSQIHPKEKKLLPRPLIHFVCVCLCACARACVCRPRPDEPECLKVSLSETSVRLGEALAGNISESQLGSSVFTHAKCVQISDSQAFLWATPVCLASRIQSLFIESVTLACLHLQI